MSTPQMLTDLKGMLTALRDPACEEIFVAATSNGEWPEDSIEQIAAILPSCHNLRSFNICNMNYICAGRPLEDCRAILEILPSLNIKELYLQGGSISGDVTAGNLQMEMLAEILPQMDVQALHLNGLEMTAKGAAILGAVLPLTNIRTIEMRNNGIGSGIEDLMRGAVQSRLQKLVLENCRLKAAETDVVLRELPKTGLTELSLFNCELPDQAEEKIRAAVGDSCLMGLKVYRQDLPEEDRERLQNIPRENAQRIWQAFKEGDKQGWTAENIGFLLDHAPCLESQMRKDGKTDDEITEFYTGLAENMAAAGLPVQDVVLRALPLPDAADWLAARGQPLSITNLLDDNGSFPQDRFTCQRGANALVENPDLWEDSARDLKQAMTSLPPDQHSLIVSHQFMASLGRKVRAEQKLSGRE